MARKAKVRKLVRDRIADEISQEGRPLHKVEVVPELKDLLLRRKALEETLELCKAADSTSLGEEIADILEVLHALAEEHGISMETIESIRIEKRGRLGAFDKGVFIDYVAPQKHEPEVGLFGPMDYVSISKRTPRVQEVRIEEEHLLRIPLLPSLFGEEIRVGNYCVICSEREILKISA
jgi:predicted house-cleaning noncanonical NTP pyrophosphatase (MazG superfamily)